MPAAAVIPAPLAYTIIVAVKRLVVGLNIYAILFVYLNNILTFRSTQALITKVQNAQNLDQYTKIITKVKRKHSLNTVNKSECIKHVI